MREFDAFASSYESEMEHAIGFGGMEHDFYVERKADVLLELVTRRIGDTRRLRALDVGCGRGYYDTLLASHFASLTAVDPAEQLIHQAKLLNPSIDYIVADGTALPFQDGTFDVCFAACVLHHVDRDRQNLFAHELSRVLAPGGLAVIFEHNRVNPATRLVVTRCAFDEDVRLLTPRRTAHLLTQQGLERTESGYILFFPSRSRTLGRIERGLRWLPLGAQYYLAASKGTDAFVSTTSSTR